MLIAERRRQSGARAQLRGLAAEAVARRVLEADGWTVLGERLRTTAGEVDMVVRRAGLIAFVEVKARPSLAEAAYALSARQSRRLLLAAEILLAANPDWADADLRFDVLLVDVAGRVRRITDALRAGAPTAA